MKSIDLLWKYCMEISYQIFTIFLFLPVSKEVYYRLNNSYTHLQAATGKAFAFIVWKKPDADPSEHIQDNKLIYGPVLPWALTMKLIEPQCIQDTAAIILSSSLCSKLLQNHSSPVPFPLCSPFDTFYPYLDYSSFTHLSAPVSSLIFLEAALLKPLA